MDTREVTPSGFTQRRLPWIVAGGAVALYLLTLNRWCRLESLPVVAKLTGWDWTPTVQAPLLFLVTYPLRWLPPAIQPGALNALSAVMAALTLALLARSVALLPYDRTRPSRLRERGPNAWLSVPLAWVPPVVAAVACGLQASFWEHATAITGEMLDLLLFAYVLRCLLEYRLEKEERWLYKLAFVYGVAVTNNYAMIAFFPCCVIALIWVTGLAFFRLGFLARMAGCGAAGLLLYLVLPLAGTFSGEGVVTFGQHLRQVLGTQKSALGAFPPYIILLLSFTSLIPALILGIRWASKTGETSAAGVEFTNLMTHLVHAALLVACLSVFFDTRWSPRSLGYPLALLPFYYLAALCVGYFCGYFLLMARPPVGPGRVRPAGGAVAILLPVAVLLVAAAVPVSLLTTNLPMVRRSDGRALSRLAELLDRSIPAQPAYLVSDDPTEMLVAEAGLHRHRGSHPHVTVYSRLLEFVTYHEQLAQHYRQRWPKLPAGAPLPEPLDARLLVRLMTDLARSNQLYYLHPSMGYYFEAFWLRPEGAVYQMQPLPGKTVAPPALAAAEIEANNRFWAAAWPEVTAVAPLDSRSSVDTAYVARFYSRVLNDWGVMLQRHGQAGDAGRFFEQAARINPGNHFAGLNLELNAQLQKGVLGPVDLTRRVEIRGEPPYWDGLLLANGRVDDPLWAFNLGRVFLQNGHFRQALQEFHRVQSLCPTNQLASVWAQTTEVMVRASDGDLPAAEKQALALVANFPRDDVVLETLTQVYLLAGQMSNALASVQRQIEVNTNNVQALLNLAAVSITLNQFSNAIPVLDRFLALQPDDARGLLNRAIARLQLGQFDLAQRDYESLRRKQPRSYAVYYGLGEIAYRRQRTAEALEAYELYLKYGVKGTDEYRSIEKRVDELRGGSAAR